MKGIILGTIIGIVGAFIVMGVINASKESAQVKEQKAGTIKTALEDGDHPVYRDMAADDYAAYAEESIRVQALIEERGVSYIWDVPSGYDMIGGRFLFARYDNVPTMTGEHTLYSLVSCEKIIDGDQIVDQPTIRSGRFTRVFWDDEAQLLLAVMQQMEVVIVAFRPGTEEKPYSPSTRRGSGSWRFSSITRRSGGKIVGTTPKGIEWILASDMRWTEASNLVNKQ